MNGGQYFPTLAQYKAGQATAACRLERQFHAAPLTAPLH
jgi:hypothetical protein